MHNVFVIGCEVNKKGSICQKNFAKSGIGLVRPVRLVGPVRLVRLVGLV